MFMIFQLSNGYWCRSAPVQRARHLLQRCPLPGPRTPSFTHGLSLEIAAQAHSKSQGMHLCQATSWQFQHMRRGMLWGQPARHLRGADGVGGVAGVVQVQRHVPQPLRGLRAAGQAQVQRIGFRVDNPRHGVLKCQHHVLQPFRGLRAAGQGQVWDLGFIT